MRGTSFEVGRGEVFCLLGPNGAGKTTTVEIPEGYRLCSGGEVRVLVSDPAAGERELRDHHATRRPDLPRRADNRV